MSPTTKVPEGRLFGTSLLQLATYWYLVAHFNVWALGITAFSVALALNAMHSYIRSAL